MPADTRLQDEMHLKVLRQLEQKPDQSQRDLADALGVSLGKANYCLAALVRKGLVKMENFRRSNNKLKYAYLLTPRGLEAKARLATAFLDRKKAEYEALLLEIETLEREVGVPPPLGKRRN